MAVLEGVCLVLGGGGGGGGGWERGCTFVGWLALLSSSSSSPLPPWACTQQPGAGQLSAQAGVEHPLERILVAVANNQSEREESPTLDPTAKTDTT